MQRIFIIFFLFGCLAADAQKIYSVAKDGKADFQTVQAAVTAVPVGNKTPVIINIAPGIYKERVFIDSGKNFISLQGKKGASTVISFGLHNGSVLHNGDTLNTMNCATVMIFADDFKASNIAFQNTAGIYAGQAVALRAEGTRMDFFNCGFSGFQDVLFLSGARSKQYFENCFIEGSTDFIFGAATAVFENCRIHSKKNSHITAASTPADIPYGFVFQNCALTSDAGLDNVSLGRPWRPYASVTYINCTMGKHIRPAGWDNWKNEANEKTARFAEYNSSGPGAKPADRVSWSRQLSTTEVKSLTLKKIFGSWNPRP